MIFIALLIGFICGWLMLRSLINYKMRMMLESIAETPIITNRIDIDIVKIKNKYYVYRREDNFFLVHGDTKEDLTQQLHKRWPNKAFMASPKNLEEVGLK